MFGLNKKKDIDKEKKEIKKLFKDFHKQNKRKGKIVSIKYS